MLRSLLGGFRKPPHESEGEIVAALLKTNGLPSDEQRAALLLSLQELEEKVQTLRSGNKQGVIPQPAGDLRSQYLEEAIRRHRLCLSCVRRVPEEIWGHILTLALEDGDRRLPSSISIVQGLSSISRAIRSAALRECILWTALPAITLLPNRSRIAHQTDIFKKFLQRSGTLPISWSLAFGSKIWGSDHTSGITSLLQLLADHCHRWEDVRLEIPFSAVEQLAPIKGKLPVLSTLRLYVHRKETPGENIRCLPAQIDYFLEAPALHTVTWKDVSSQPFVVSLPWSQLVDVTVISRDRTPYHSLIALQTPTLRKLRYEIVSTVFDAEPPPHLSPRAPFTLPHVGTLCLKASTMSGTFVPVDIDSLILPSLTDLEIEGWLDITASLYDRVESLVARSGCHLNRLALGADGDDIFSHWQIQLICFPLITSLCSAITHLDLVDVREDIFPLLLLDPASANPVLPKLRILVLRFRFAYVDAEISRAFWEVAESRTNLLTQARLGSTDNGDRFQVLEEVRFVFETSDLMQGDVQESVDAPAGPPYDGDDMELMTLAKKARQCLKSAFRSDGAPLRTIASLKLQLELDTVLKKLEKLNLENRQSYPLTLKSVPALLRSISSLPSGSIPGDQVFRFRRRASRICEKWRPHLLRDYQGDRFPFRWSYPKPGEAVLKWHPPSRSDHFDEDEIWKEVGTGPLPY